jgi:DNA-binding beta-propeller fold protein YncE
VGAPGTSDVYHSLSYPKRTIRGTKSHQFASITCLAISPTTGDVAVCVSDRHVIAKFSPTGKFIGECGGYGLGPGLFNKPRGITFNQQEQIIVADSLNHRIQIVDSTRNLATSFGQKGNRGYDVNTPCDVAAISTDIWVCDRGNNRIRKFTKDGRNTCGNNITTIEFHEPTRIIHDDLHGTVCVLDSMGLHCFKPTDKTSNVFKKVTKELGEYRDITRESAIAFSEDGHLIYSYSSNKLAIYDSNAKLVNTFTSKEAVATKVPITAVAIRNGCVVVAGSKYLEIY